MGRPRKLVKERDKEQTKRKLIEAVGEIFRTEGFTALGVNRIQRRSGVSKKLIYTYFGSLNNLIEAYIAERDYWMVLSSRISGKLESREVERYKRVDQLYTGGRAPFFLLGKGDAENYSLAISEQHPLLRSISNFREMMGSDILSATDPDFAGSGVNLRAVTALLVGGIYYTILHAKSNGSTVCGIDLNQETDREEVIKTTRQIIDWAFGAAKAQADQGNRFVTEKFISD